jgi:exodeoxyribonuclease VII large subunit
VSLREEAPTLSVSDLYGLVEQGLARSVPHPVWVRGEISGLRRTSGGALFFRLADDAVDGRVIEVAARGRIAMEVDRSLDAAGMGRLRDGIAVRLRATVGVDAGRSVLRLSLLEVDPAFTAGRLAVDREMVLRRMSADGSLATNRRRPLPLVPLRIGLVTSRGSAGHADLLDQLRRSGFRFAVRTAHAAMQGENAVPQISRAMARLAEEDLDVIVMVRGGGAKLDLAAFDSEEVGRAVAAAPVPVLTGIGHETDRSVADEAAAVALKTPTAVGEWLTSRVSEYSGRVDLARRLIADEARAACEREAGRLRQSAALLGASRATLGRHRDRIDHLEASIARSARTMLRRERERLRVTEEAIADLGVEETLERGFALVTDQEGRVVRSAAALSAGDSVRVRFADGEIAATVGAME